MNRILLRIVAIFLVPCLIGDPVTVMGSIGPVGAVAIQGDCPQSESHSIQSIQISGRHRVPLQFPFASQALAQSTYASKFLGAHIISWVVERVRTSLPPSGGFRPLIVSLVKSARHTFERLTRWVHQAFLQACVPGNRGVTANVPEWADAGSAESGGTRPRIAFYSLIAVLLAAMRWLGFWLGLEIVAPLMMVWMLSPGLRVAWRGAPGSGQSRWPIVRSVGFGFLFASAMLAAGLMIAWLSGMSLEVDPVRGILIIPLIAQNLTASPGEELLHRQWLYQKFKTKLGRPRALILQAVIFSAGHIQNWFFGEPVLFASYLSRFFGGVILGLAFDEAGLAAACVAHFLFNVELDVVLFGSSKRGWLATVVSLAVGGLIALAAHRWINRPRDGTSVTNHAEDTMPPTGPAAQPCPACRAA